MGQLISIDVKKVALSMSLHRVPDSLIHQYTSISIQTMKCLRQQHCNLTFPLPPLVELGRPHLLSGIQVKVCTQFFCARCCLTGT